MFKSLANAFRKMSEQETLRERSARMIPGAVYGFIAASAYTLTLSLINIISFPGLHLAMDWVRILTYWLGYGLALALAGLIVGWFTESYMGIIVGGLILTGVLLVGNLLLSLLAHGGASMAALSVVTALPLVGAGILLALGIRMAINRHIHIMHDEPRQGQRKLVLGLAAIVFLVGFVPGFLGRYDGSTVDVIKQINANLAAAVTDPIGAASRFPISKYPALKNHFGMEYQLYPRASSLSTGSMDITIRFSDGYSLTCNVSTAESSQVYLTDCNEGNSYISQ